MVQSDVDRNETQARRVQYSAVLVLAVVVSVLAGVLSLWDAAPFHRYFGDSIPPLLVVVAVAILGAACLGFLRAHAGFTVYATQPRGAGLGRAAAVAILFALAMIGIDALAVFPTDLNVRAPESLLFYPVMGFVAEVTFHLVPLALLLALPWLAGWQIKHDVVIWSALAVVSLLEPAFQVIAGFSSAPPLWAQACIALHLMAFNAFGLGLFKRYDFVTMYGFRLVYYVVWHVIWGELRLELLF